MSHMCDAELRTRELSIPMRYTFGWFTTNLTFVDLLSGVRFVTACSTFDRSLPTLSPQSPGSPCTQRNEAGADNATHIRQDVNSPQEENDEKHDDQSDTSNPPTINQPYEQ
ncbi:hypothetical protein TSMEX_006821 [Taenia solium]|eukprot:TsM_000970500 transcript=TsM_000970500 gene=TsM_000970500